MIKKILKKKKKNQKYPIYIRSESTG